MKAPLIQLTGIKNYLGASWVHTGVNLTVVRGEILAIIGGSGAGKSTLLRTLLFLQTPTAGTLEVFGQRLTTTDSTALQNFRRRSGVLFQRGALFSALTLLENVSFALRAHTRLSTSIINELALLKILAVGLTPADAHKYPSELSGGMQKRAALARALVTDPEILFLDEPTAGLDPHSAAAFDQLIVTLQKNLELTIVMVTHDLDTLQITNRVAFLGEGRIIATAPVTALMQMPDPLIQAYFAGPRSTTLRAFAGS